MNYPGYTNAIIEIKEGNTYPFKIYNYIQLPDNEYYYILLDINGLKHFMPAVCYKSYKFSIGDSIQCKIDKINCTGRMHLEPENPYYKIGLHYSFPILEKTQNGDLSILKLKDFFGNNIEIEVPNFMIQGLGNKKIINCRIKNIKKGIPELEVV